MALWQPCAFEISQHMALTAPSANRPTSPTSPTCPTFFARSIGTAQCAFPANRTHSPVLSKFQSAWHTGCHRPFTVFPVFAVFMVSLLPPCALRKVLCQPTEHTAKCFGNSGAHGSHCTKCPSSVQVRTSPYKSVFPCPHPVHCTKCPASQREYAMHREAPWAKGGHFLGKKLVPAVGVEPTRLLPVDFESTASAIPPRWHLSVLHKNA